MNVTHLVEKVVVDLFLCGCWLVSLYVWLCLTLVNVYLWGINDCNMSVLSVMNEFVSISPKSANRENSKYKGELTVNLR